MSRVGTAIFGRRVDVIIVPFWARSDVYGRELVDLRKEGRWEFLNTLFSVSEAVMYMQVGIRPLPAHRFAADSVLSLCELRFVESCEPSFGQLMASYDPDRALWSRVRLNAKRRKDLSARTA